MLSVARRAELNVQPTRAGTVNRVIEHRAPIEKLHREVPNLVPLYLAFARDEWTLDRAEAAQRLRSYLGSLDYSPRLWQLPSRRMDVARMKTARHVLIEAPRGASFVSPVWYTMIGLPLTYLRRLWVSGRARPDNAYYRRDDTQWREASRPRPVAAPVADVCVFMLRRHASPRQCTVNQGDAHGTCPARRPYASARACPDRRRRGSDSAAVDQ